MGQSEQPHAALKRLIDGYQVSQALHVAATLGIADLLANASRTSDELAAEAGAHAPSLYRLLRALASVGVLREEEGRRFALTPLGEGLRSDLDEGLAGWAAFVGRPYYWQAWAHLLHSVLTGENAFRHAHGVDVWEYRVRNPEENAIFDRAMTQLTRLSNRSLLAAYDFGRFGTVVDVGGGQGFLLAALLTAHPELGGVLFDQPHVVAGAPAVLETAGVTGRCRIVAGSFFDGVPEGGDLYVLKAIIHDWEDDSATAILRACRGAVGSEGVLLLVERELGPPNEVPAAKLSDLNMLVSPGGRERSVEEYEALLEAAGFRLTGAIPTSAGLMLLEAAPRSRAG